MIEESYIQLIIGKCFKGSNVLLLGVCLKTITSSKNCFVSSTSFGAKKMVLIFLKQNLICRLFRSIGTEIFAEMLY